MENSKPHLPMSDKQTLTASPDGTLFIIHVDDAVYDFAGNEYHIPAKHAYVINQLLDRQLRGPSVSTDPVETEVEIAQHIAAGNYQKAMDLIAEGEPDLNLLGMLAVARELNISNQFRLRHELQLQDIKRELRAQNEKINRH